MMIPRRDGDGIWQRGAPATLCLCDPPPAQPGAPQPREVMTWIETPESLDEEA